MFWHKCRKTASPRAVTASRSVPCPAMARHCRTLRHSEGCSGHHPLQVLCLPRGLPRVPGTALPRVGSRGWRGCAELSHPNNPSGGVYVCAHTSELACQRFLLCMGLFPLTRIPGSCLPAVCLSVLAARCPARPLALGLAPACVSACREPPCLLQHWQLVPAQRPV